MNDDKIIQDLIQACEIARNVLSRQAIWLKSDTEALATCAMLDVMIERAKTPKEDVCGNKS